MSSSSGTPTHQGPASPDGAAHTAGFAGRFAGLVPGGVELREGFAQVGDQRLHYVEAGEGPLVLLLHGFPEFWFGWRRQIAPLAAAGFRVVAPDMRGYNESSKPPGIAAYAADKVADDISGLIRERGGASALVVGHDWGGSVAWTLAMNHPDIVERLAILDAAHPRSLAKGLRDPRQLARSWYFFFFALPDLPERVVRGDRFRFFQRFLRDAKPPYTAEEMDRYVEAWSQKGALTGMIDYYRCSVRPPKGAKQKISTVSAPTLVIWGKDDRYLGPGVREPDRADVPNLDRVEQLPNASHWVHHDQPEAVNRLLIDFFNGARSVPTP
ncbi:MAG TPA: alpha/beta hydrolase [Solirubrobacteraceae bacterium]|jgi:pimeloyl-ACP methyl ester carboxylesterase|nr:alpha/beta hydrolase [Solirubrobacteraceae bacterium]